MAVVAVTSSADAPDGANFRPSRCGLRGVSGRVLLVSSHGHRARDIMSNRICDVGGQQSVVAGPSDFG